MEIDDRHRRFAQWLCTPKDDREPRKQADLAHELGLDPGRLSQIKKDPDFLKVWNETHLATIGHPDRKSEIMNVLFESATDYDNPRHIQAAKAYMEIEGSLKPRGSQINVGDGGTVRVSAQDLSDEQLEQLAASKAVDELAQRREQSA